MKNKSEKTESPSRSAKKRTSTALQKIGEQLCRLPAAIRKSLNLPADLATALDEHDTMKSRESARRQRQYIGRLMREADAEELLSAIGGIMKTGCPSQPLLLSIRDELLALRKAEPKKGQMENGE